MPSSTEILTPRARGKITRSVAQYGRWSGRRQGFKLTFQATRGRFIFTDSQHTDELDWTITDRLGLVIGRGSSNTVFDAAQDIAAAIDQHRRRDSQ